MAFSFLPQPFTAEIEHKFLLDYSERFISQRRLVLAIGIFFSISYFVFDVITALDDNVYNEKFLIFDSIKARIIIIVGLTISTIFLFSHEAKINEYYASCCIYLATLSFFSGLLYIACFVPFPEYYAYFHDGMLQVLLVLFGTSRILTKPTIILVIFLVIVAIISFNIGNPNVHLYDQPIITLVMFSLLGCIISRNQEISARDSFKREKELKKAHEQIESTSNELITLTTKKQEQAEQHIQEKVKIITSFAHDIKGMIQPISNFLHTAYSSILSNDKKLAQGYIEQAITSNESMSILFKSLISTLTGFNDEIQYSSFDICQLIHEVIVENTSLANEYKVKILSKDKPLKIIVNSDRNQLKRVISNILSNSIKYSDPNKAAIAMIAIVSHNNKIRLDMIDNGIGIQQSELEHITKPFIQLNNSERDLTKGIGLGLYIVDSIIKRLNHHALTIKSKHTIGSRFSLILPQGDELNSVQLIDTDYDFRGLRVLLVEDHIKTKESWIALLKSNGAECEAVSSVEELKILLSIRYDDFDVVVSDYHLPDGNAIDVISLLNDDALPILIVTGELTDLSNELQGKTILRKPVEPRQFLKEIINLYQVFSGIDNKSRTEYAKSQDNFSNL